MNEPVIGMKWIITTIRADGTMDGYINNRIYETEAPQHTSFPYIVITATPRDDVVGIGLARLFSVVDYNILVVNTGSDYGSITAIDARLDALLHDKMASITEGEILQSARESPIAYRDRDDAGIAYVYLGGRYSLSIQSA